MMNVKVSPQNFARVITESHFLSGENFHAYIFLFSETLSPLKGGQNICSLLAIFFMCGAVFRDAKMKVFAYEHSVWFPT